MAVNKIPIPYRNLIVEKHSKKYLEDCDKVETRIAEELNKSEELPLMIPTSLLGNKNQIINEMVRRLKTYGYTVEQDKDCFIIK